MEATLLILAWIIPMLGSLYKLWITVNNPSAYFLGDEIKEKFSHKVIICLVPIVNAFYLLILLLEFSRNEKGLREVSFLDRWLLKKFTNKKDKV